MILIHRQHSFPFSHAEVLRLFSACFTSVAVLRPTSTPHRNLYSRLFQVRGWLFDVARILSWENRWYSTTKFLGESQNRSRPTRRKTLLREGSN